MTLRKFAFHISAAALCAAAVGSTPPKAQFSFGSAVNARNPQTIAALYSADATLALPGATAVRGKSEIAAAWSHLLGVVTIATDRANPPARPIASSSKFNLSNVRTSRDTKLRLEEALFTLNVSQGGELTAELRGHVSTLWKLEPSGVWLITMQTFTQDPSSGVMR